MPGKQNIRIRLTTLIGIVAAIIGTFIASALGVNDTKGFVVRIDRNESPQIPAGMTTACGVECLNESRW